MDILNYDCWLYIMELITLKDQIAAIQTCVYFQSLVRKIWRKKYKQLHYNFFEMQMCSSEEFQIFIKNICETTNKVILKFLTKDKYEILQNCVFLEVHDFRFSQMSPFFMTDDDHLRLYKVFPNLKIYSPHGAFTGKQIVCFQQLEDLTLSYCQKLKASYFKEILVNLNLKSLKLDIFQYELPLLSDVKHNLCNLEKIAFNSFEADLLFGEDQYIKHCRHLQEITILDRIKPLSISIIYKMLTEYKSKNVTSIEISNLQQNVSNIDDDIAFASDASALLQLTNYFGLLHSLREVKFYSCHFEKDDHIQNLLQSSDVIELVSLEGCNFNFDIVEVNVAQIVKKRTKLLTFNFYENAKDDYHGEIILVDLIVKGKSDLFKLTKQKTLNITYDPLRFLLEPDC